MNRILLMVGILLGVVFVELSNGLSCVPCHRRKCKSPKCEPEDQIRDLCGCCTICGGLVGDPCSGVRRCASDLWCISVKDKKADARLNLRWSDPFQGVCGILDTGEEYYNDW